ncbi:DUF6319 family protein [Prauserella muralis]|uniref:Uncharacterized protein n=1 Tax=Prauserella muralis TaxID=588067 RepID=A0A2V4B7I9_9PSEU|nr:DUF6319 family protein [Prauserella muralis]PXY31210.1 hypothetical protein BAY60_02035 [Prauserella muralis]TWE14488.1 hypothetical protein FHX69_6637 [Prauserella muralis]
MSLDTSISPEEQVSSENAADSTAAAEPAQPAEGAPNAEGKQNGESAPADSTENKPKRGRPKGSGARKTRTVELTLTVTGTADGEWQAELKHGSKWVARGLDIPAAAVSRAAKELHAELSGPIDEVINAAREQQQAKVAELEAELERAKQALAELES